MSRDRDRFLADPGLQEFVRRAVPDEFDEIATCPQPASVNYVLVIRGDTAASRNRIPLIQGEPVMSDVDAPDFDEA
jgi:hypothetical protein